MKRSSKLILILGIVLAVAAFGGVLFFSSSLSGPNTPPPPTTTKMVVAASDIALGTTVVPALVATKDVAITDAPPDGFSDPSGITGRVVRRDIRAGEVLRSSDFSSGTSARGDDVLRALKAGYRAMAIQVDQTTGVGTLIQPGDSVDVVIGFAISTLWPGKEPTDPPSELSGGPQLSVKTIVQNVEVLGTLVQIPEQQASQTPAESGTSEGQSGSATQGVTMAGQQQIVIVAVTAEQAEVIKYAQVKSYGMPELAISLVLRAPADRDAPADETSGMTLRTLIDKYGVLPPVPLVTAPLQ